VTKEVKVYSMETRWRRWIWPPGCKSQRPPAFPWRPSQRAFGWHSHRRSQSWTWCFEPEKKLHKFYCEQPVSETMMWFESVYWDQW